MPAGTARRWTAREVRQLIRHDRARKRLVYQRHVPDYWIVDLDARLIERWMPNEARPELLTDTLIWHPTDAATPFTLDIPAYFRSVLDT